MWRIYLSRFLNYYLLDGDPNEMLSSRLHRECWKLETVVDCIFFWHYQHCARCYRYERMFKCDSQKLNSSDGKDVGG